MSDTGAARFTHIYEQYYSAVLSYALRRVPPEQAADVVAETFLVAWRRLQDVPGYPLPWLLVVARNTLSQHRRSAYRISVLTAELANLQHLRDEAGDDIQTTIAERITVLAAVAALSAQDREALMLTAWDGLSAKDAAAVAGCSPATFAVRLHRARQRLARALELPTKLLQANPADRAHHHDKAATNTPQEAS